MKVNRSFKFRIYPNKSQERLIQKTFGCTRFVYNHILSRAKKSYELEKKNKIITPAVLKKEYDFLKEVDSLALANAQQNIKVAFNNFFKKKAGFPKFKCKEDFKKTYTTNNVNNSIRIENKKLRLPKIGLVKIKLHRNISEDNRIKSVTISEDSERKYFVSILTEFEKDKKLAKRENIVCLKPFLEEWLKNLSLEENNYYENLKRQKNLIKEEKKILLKMEKNSSDCTKQKLRVQKKKNKLKEIRKDFLHKFSKKIIESYDCLVLGELENKEFIKSEKFKVLFGETGLGTLVIFLKYKAKLYDRSILTLNEKYKIEERCIGQEINVQDMEG